MDCLMIILNGEETMFVYVRACACAYEREVGYLFRKV